MTYVCGSTPVSSKKSGPFSDQNKKILSLYASRKYARLEACPLFKEPSTPTQGLGWLSQWLPGARPQNEEPGKGIADVVMISQKAREKPASYGAGQLICDAVVYALSPLITYAVPVVGSVIATGVEVAAKATYKYASKPSSSNKLAALNFMGVINCDGKGAYFDNNGTPLHLRDVRDIHVAVRQVELASKLYHAPREKIHQVISHYFVGNPMDVSSSMVTFVIKGLDGQHITAKELERIQDGIDCLESDNLMSLEEPVIEMIEILTAHIPIFDNSADVNEFLDDAVLIRT